MILRYGKTWTEETSLPAEVQGASFTSDRLRRLRSARRLLAKQPNAGNERYVGGLLVNDGSGWQVDREAHIAAQSSAEPSRGRRRRCPTAARRSSSRRPAAVHVVFEREGAGRAVADSPTPLPGIDAGRSRCSAKAARCARSSPAAARGSSIRLEQASSNRRPGFPRRRRPPASPAARKQAALLRQTATGWSDQRHEVDIGTAPAGDYEYHDLPYTPDPLIAMLVDPTGGDGWAVGGCQLGEEVRQTADIERYPAKTA